MLPSTTMQYPQRCSTLHNAVMKGDRSDTLAALKDRPQLEERSRSMTPLQSAAHSGHFDLFPLLLAGGAEVNAAPSELGCVIQAAISSLWFGGIPDKMALRDEGKVRQKKDAQMEAVRFLLEHGANPSTSGGEFGSPIAAAAAFGSLDVVKLLLANGASPNSPGGRFGSALQAACAQGGMPVGWSVSCALPNDYTEVQEILLQSEAQVNHVGGLYGTALEAAAFLGETTIISRLLEKGADPNIRAGKYGSALGAAADQGHLSVVKILLEAGARTRNDAAVKPHDHDD